MPSSPNYLANGNIYPCRFVKIDSTAGKNFSVIQSAAASDKSIGVSQVGTRLAQIEGLTATAYAASAGDNLRVFGPGEQCLVECAGTITQGDWVTADADGKAVAITVSGTVCHAAFALESGVSGDFIRVFLNPFICKYS